MEEVRTQMTRQQEISNPLLNNILMPTIPANKFSLNHLRLQE
jgi:hypothetical protein